MKKKVIRTSTVPMSLDLLLKGQLAYLNQYFDVVAVSGRGTHLSRVAERESVRTIEVKMQRQISLLSDLGSLFKLYHVFREEKPEIVHSITPKAGLLSMMAAYYAHVPVRIHTFTGLLFPSKKGFMHILLKAMDRLTCRFATCIVPEGKGVKHDLETYGITNKKMKVIGNGNVNGLDLEYYDRKCIAEETIFELKQSLKIKENETVFCFIGRLTKDKGVNELIDAFKMVNKEYPSSKLLLVGPFEQASDPITPETEREIHQNSSIVWVGYQDDIRTYLAISDYLVFPSYREGFPNVPMQALAMDIPVIVTDINGCNEIVSDGENGLIIQPGDTEAIHHAMVRLLQDRFLKEKMITNARKSVASRYDQRVLWALIRKTYDAQLDRMKA